MTNKRATGEAPPNSEVGDKDKIWTFFNIYKISGKGETIPRPNIDSFSHVSDASKEKDKAMVAKRKKRPNLRTQRETGPDSFAFENFLTAQAQRNNWFGGELSPTTEYDDWISGVDAIVEWIGEDGEPIRLAIDFTAAKESETFFRKSEKLEGNLQVKYVRSKVESEDGVPKEIRASMPLVLLGFDSSVYFVIAQQKRTIDHEHPLRRMLLEQASAQIDLQLELLIQKVFTSQRSKRSKGIGNSQQEFKALGKDFSADQAMEFFEGLDPDVLDAVMHPKNQNRAKDLIRLKHQLGIELENTSEIEFDNEWQELARSSKTHNILSA